MPTPPLFFKEPFPKIKEAREALKAKALAMWQVYEKAVEKALEAGEYEVAIKAMQWAMEHAPDHEGVSMINRSIDSKEIDSKKAEGPHIQIGIALVPKQLEPAKTVEAEVISVRDTQDPTDSPDSNRPKS